MMAAPPVSQQAPPGHAHRCPSQFPNAGRHLTFGRRALQSRPRAAATDGHTSSHRGAVRSRISTSATAEQSTQFQALQPDSTTISFADKQLTMQTGEIGRLANGAVTARQGNTVVYATACTGQEAAGDFLPLSVSYAERFSAAGRTSGGFMKREGRVRDHEVLTARLIDRPLRPLMPKRFRLDTQVLAWCLSFDPSVPPEPLAITAASAAMMLSDIPFGGPMAAVRVGLLGNTFVINPSAAEMDKSSLDLVLAGTSDRLAMIEGYCSFLTDAQMEEAVEFGMKAVRELCAGLLAWQQRTGKSKMAVQEPTQPEAEVLQQDISAQLQEVYRKGLSKLARNEAITQLRVSMEEQYNSERSAVADGGADTDSDQASTTTTSSEQATNEFSKAFWAAEATAVRAMAASGLRADGRSISDVRPIQCRASVLPMVHGSALFTRGETQALAVTTLGGIRAAQQIDTMQSEEEQAQRFSLQYFFPPSAVGETGRIGGLGNRREIGHGRLAERSLAPALPSKEEFPYVVRVESTITESNGSSSMASVCSGWLAMRDAGVPLERQVAGVAMGLITDHASDSYTILTDILGSEDAMGDMDLKVAGDRDGITAFQMDVKVAGIPLSVVPEALKAAKAARGVVLDRMASCSPPPRGSLAPHAPHVLRLVVPADFIGMVIGGGGRTIKQLQAESGCEVRFLESEEGVLEIIGHSDEAVQAARDTVMDIITEPEEGAIYRQVPVRRAEGFGVIVQFTASKEGLCHKTELQDGPAADPSAWSEGDLIDVQLLEAREGRYRLSRRAVLRADAGLPVASASSNGASSGSKSAAPQPAGPAPEIGAIIRDVEIKFITPTAAFVEASPGRPLYFCPIGELSTSNVTNVHDYFRAGQKIDGIVLPPRDNRPTFSRKALLVKEGGPNAADPKMPMSTKRA